MTATAVLEAPAAAHRPTEAEPPEEIFDIYNEDGVLIGQEKRAVVHKLGLLHKAVYCFVFNPQGQLLIQQRSQQKKIGPGQWDLSVAEHLSPGEDYQTAAQRGLQEELGIAAPLPDQPLGAPHLRRLVIPGQYLDCEFVQSYKLTGWSGQVSVNPVEVAATRWVGLQQLQDEMARQPDTFTEWFRDEATLYLWSTYGVLIGQEKRAVVHKLGLLHKAVYCCVFNPQGQLLIQQRSQQKKIGPGQWDLSVAEHLSPGEDYQTAAQRGLQEELGIAAPLPDQPLGAPHLRRLVIPGQYLDCEFVQSYKLTGWSGQVSVNPVEVAATRWVGLQQLQDEMARQPDTFTEWFRDEATLVGLFEGRVVPLAAGGPC